MFRRFFHTPTRLVLSFALVVTLALGTAWAKTFYASAFVRTSQKTIRINRNAKFAVPEGALEAYLDEQGKNRVEITIEMVSTVEQNDDLLYSPFLQLQLRQL